MIGAGKKIDTQLPFKVFRNGNVEATRLADLLTRRTIISVYMRNNTPGCDRQNNSLAAQAGAFERAGYNLVALSRDTASSHARYRAASIRRWR